MMSDDGEWPGYLFTVDRPALTVLSGGMNYDSTDETLKHIGRVQGLLHDVCDNLEARAVAHDQTKLEEDEKPLFDEYTPRLAKMEYGTDEYKECLDGLRPALTHHYKHNSHHPEHYADGIRGMSLLDLIEMLVDWKAAGERHADGGNLGRSIEMNQKRFGYGDELREILENTARELRLL